jgi:hypothetical protein
MNRDGQGINGFVVHGTMATMMALGPSLSELPARQVAQMAATAPAELSDSDVGELDPFTPRGVRCDLCNNRTIAAPCGSCGALLCGRCAWKVLRDVLHRGILHRDVSCEACDGSMHIVLPGEGDDEQVHRDGGDQS